MLAGRLGRGRPTRRSGPGGRQAARAAVRSAMRGACRCRVSLNRRRPDHGHPDEVAAAENPSGCSHVASPRKDAAGFPVEPGERVLEQPAGEIGG